MEVGSGPFGGTGSDLVCDRELLIGSLRARPDRLEEWARVLGRGAGDRRGGALHPEAAAGHAHARHARDQPLVRGRPRGGVQSILQAGTAVLVDENGRARGALPLRQPAAGARLHEDREVPRLPAQLHTAAHCGYVDYGVEYSDYDGDEYLRVYRRRDFTDACYLPYPDPPR